MKALDHHVNFWLVNPVNPNSQIQRFIKHFNSIMPQKRVITL